MKATELHVDSHRATTGPWLIYWEIDNGEVTGSVFVTFKNTPYKIFARALVEAIRLAWGKGNKRIVVHNNVESVSTRLVKTCIQFPSRWFCDVAQLIDETGVELEWK